MDFWERFFRVMNFQNPGKIPVSFFGTWPETKVRWHGEGLDFDLGAHKNVVILSIPEGDDKPYKYPAIFMEADIVLVNKIDVHPYFDFDQDTFPEIINGLNPSATVLSVSVKSGEGLDDWFSWISSVV